MEAVRERAALKEAEEFRKFADSELAMYLKEKGLKEVDNYHLFSLWMMSRMYTYHKIVMDVQAMFNNEGLNLNKELRRLGR